MNKGTLASDWLYGIGLKIKICEQFLERIDELASLNVQGSTTITFCTYGKKSQMS